MLEKNSLQTLYLVLVLPALFGLVLVSEGIRKIIKRESGGGVSLVVGMVFLGVIGLTYWMFSK